MGIRYTLGEIAKYIKYLKIKNILDYKYTYISIETETVLRF